MSQRAPRWLLIFDDGHGHRQEVFCEQEPPEDWTLIPTRAALEQQYGLTGDWHRMGHNTLTQVASYGRWESPRP